MEAQYFHQDPGSSYWPPPGLKDLIYASILVKFTLIQSSKNNPFQNQKSKKILGTTKSYFLRSGEPWVAIKDKSKHKIFPTLDLSVCSIKIWVRYPDIRSNFTLIPDKDLVFEMQFMLISDREIVKFTARFTLIRAGVSSRSFRGPLSSE